MSESGPEGPPCEALYDSLARILVKRVQPEASPSAFVECDPKTLQDIREDALEGDFMSAWLVQTDFHDTDPTFLVFLQLYDYQEITSSQGESQTDQRPRRELIGHLLSNDADDKTEQYEKLIAAMARGEGLDEEEARESIVERYKECGSYCIFVMRGRSPIIVNRYFYDNYYRDLKERYLGIAPNDYEVASELVNQGLARRLNDRECKEYLFHIENVLLATLDPSEEPDTLPTDNTPAPES